MGNKASKKRQSAAGAKEADVGDYRITLLPPIGHGSFGQVCQAINMRTKQAAAAKQLHYSILGDEISVMAISEITNMLVVQQRNIVRFYNYEKDGSIFWLFMEYCNLGNLKMYLDNNASLPFHRRCEIMYQISCAILYLHQHRLRIIHRDVKPENVLMQKVQNRDVAKLTDFGFAKIYDCAESTTDSKFYSLINETKGGTASYMAPEFYLNEDGNPQYTATVDIFSEGLLLAVILDYGPNNQSVFPLSGKLHIRHKSTTAYVICQCTLNSMSLL